MKVNVLAILQSHQISTYDCAFRVGVFDLSIVTVRDRLQ